MTTSTPSRSASLELAHHPLGVLPVLHRLSRDEVAHPGQAGRPLPPHSPPAGRSMPGIMSSYRSCMIPKNPDPGLSLAHRSLPEGWAEPGSVPAGQRWPYSFWYRPYSASIWSGGSGSRPDRPLARWTVLAASSHITAAFTASRAVGPDGEYPVAAQQHGGRAVPGQGLDHGLADLLAADRANGPERDLAAELVGHRGDDAGDRLAAGRPRGRVPGCACARRRRPQASAGRCRRARRCRWTG